MRKVYSKLALSLAVDRCSSVAPELREIGPGHWVACTEV